MTRFLCIIFMPKKPKYKDKEAEYIVIKLVDWRCCFLSNDDIDIKIHIMWCQLLDSHVICQWSQSGLNGIDDDGDDWLDVFL